MAGCRWTRRASPSLQTGGLTETWTVGTGGVTANTLVSMDTSNPAKIITATSGGYGVAMSTVSAAGSVEVARYGTVLIKTDTGGATEGDLLIGGSGTASYVKDSGQTSSGQIPITTRIIGTARTTATAGNTALVELTPAHFGTQLPPGVPFTTGAGTAQAQTATYSTMWSIAALTNGLYLCWSPTAANTAAAPTFAPNGLTAEPIVKANGAALVANDIITTANACAIYNTTGTHWELQNPQTGGGSTITAAAQYSVAGYQSAGTTSNLGPIPNMNTDAAGDLISTAALVWGHLYLSGVNPQSGTSYTFTGNDEMKLTTFNNASAVGVNMPVATTAGFTVGAMFPVYNRGAGLVTITPTTSTINGASTDARTRPGRLDLL